MLVSHQLDCCGTMLTMGLPKTARAAFQELEQHCSAQFPACGCASRGTMLEGGSLIDLGVGVEGARVDCIDKQCRSRNANETTACGDKACTADQYCYESVGGPAGSVPSYSCEPLGDCRDCACLNVTACRCSGSGAQIKVFCAAP